MCFKPGPDIRVGLEAEGSEYPRVDRTDLKDCVSCCQSLPCRWNVVDIECPGLDGGNRMEEGFI